MPVMKIEILGFARGDFPKRCGFFFQREANECGHRSFIAADSSMILSLTQGSQQIAFLWKALGESELSP